ncbi:GNAT family N-acetyltransferase [Geodermatophilus sp. SYSU D00814]
MSGDTRSAVRRATRADRRPLAALLAAAFSDDPVFTAAFPPGARARDARMRLLFRLEVARSERRGGTWMTDDGAAGAVWFPPGRWASTTWEDVVQGPAAVAAFAREAPLGVRIRTVMDAHHLELPDHWYLLYVGVVPGRQGQGLGSALLRPVLDECDREGLPAYLEATCERSRGLYARLGFADREPLPLPAPAPPVFPMWRDPA